MTLATFADGESLASVRTKLNAAIDAVNALETALAGKQATLVSGTNIKTVGGVSLLGSGDVPLTNVAWATPTPQNSWTLNATYPLAYRVVMGMLQLSGIMAAGTKTDSTTIFTLPAGARPAVDMIVSVGALESSVSTAARVRIGSNGEVKVFSVNGSHNNIVFNVDVRLT